MRQLAASGWLIGALVALAIALAGGASAQRGERAVAISVGADHACVLLGSGAIECWGSDDLGQMGVPSGAFRTVSAGGYHNCGLRESGVAGCGGYNLYGQTDALSGVFSAVSAGGYRSCALSEAGEISCWMIYNGAADVPAWLREPSVAMPITGTGGLLDNGPNTWAVGLSAVAAFGLSVVLLLALRKGRAR